MTAMDNDDLKDKELFGEFEQDEIDPSGSKGMKPVFNGSMINFLRWIRISHPEVSNLRSLSDQQLFHLVNEFQGSSVHWNAWSAGFSLLFDGHSDKEGYESARTELRQLGL